MPEAQKRGRGRPSTFDRPKALQDAMTLFWENGYEGTTFDDLIAKMSISPSSFYNAFGSKERLYREATECFVEQSIAWIFGILFEEGVETSQAFSNLYEAIATQFTRSDVPRGCMVSLSGTHQAPSLTSLRDMMAGYRANTEVFLAKRINQGIAEGDMPSGIDVDGLSGYLHTLMRGMAVQARDGASREKLLTIARIGLRNLPLSTGSQKSFARVRAHDQVRPTTFRFRPSISSWLRVLCSGPRREADLAERQQLAAFRAARNELNRIASRVFDEGHAGFSGVGQPLVAPVYQDDNDGLEVLALLGESVALGLRLLLERELLEDLKLLDD